MRYRSNVPIIILSIATLAFGITLLVLGDEHMRFAGITGEKGYLLRRGLGVVLALLGALLTLRLWIGYVRILITPHELIQESVIGIVLWRKRTSLSIIEQPQVLHNVKADTLWDFNHPGSWIKFESLRIYDRIPSVLEFSVRNTTHRIGMNVEGFDGTALLAALKSAMRIQATAGGPPL